MLRLIKSSAIVGRKYVCDLIGKEVEEKDVHTVDGRRVYSKEGMDALPPFLHSRLNKLSELRFLANAFNSSTEIPSFQGIVTLRENSERISFHSTSNNLNGALDDLNAVQVSFQDAYRFPSCNDLFHIFRDKEHLLTRHASNSIHLGWEEYGHWIEVGSWMDIRYNVCDHARTRYGIAQMTKSCGGTPLGKIYMQQSQLFNNGKCYQNRYVFLDPSLDNLGFREARFPKDAKLIQVLND